MSLLEHLSLRYLYKSTEMKVDICFVQYWRYTAWSYTQNCPCTWASELCTAKCRVPDPATLPLLNTDGLFELFCAGQCIFSQMFRKVGYQAATLGKHKGRNLGPRWALNTIEAARSTNDLLSLAPRRTLDLAATRQMIRENCADM